MRDEPRNLMLIAEFFYLIVTAGTIENWEEYWNEWNWEKLGSTSERPTLVRSYLDSYCW